MAGKDASQTYLGVDRPPYGVDPIGGEQTAGDIRRRRDHEHLDRRLNAADIPPQVGGFPIPGQNKMSNIAYETDYVAWTQEQASLLDAGQFSEIDIQHLVEELRIMGASERRALKSHLKVLLAHLLKWSYQSSYPYKRSWELTIDEQRDSVTDILIASPSLRAAIDDLILAAYRGALRIAEKETGLPEKTFPSKCPWTFEQILSADFLPEAA